MTFILIIIIIALWFYIMRQSARLDHIEKYLQKHTEQFGVHADSAAELSSATLAEHAKELSPTQQTREQQTVEPSAYAQEKMVQMVPQDDSFTKFIDWLKHDWLLKVGALLVLMGVGWFVGYAIIQGWISQEMRIVMGVVLGALLGVFGWIRLQTKEVQQGEIFLVLGATIVLLTIFSAQQLYEMLSPVVALGIMFAAAAVVGFASVRFDRKVLATAGLIMANVAPYLTNTPEPSLIGLFSYLFIVSCGIVWVVATRGWVILAPIAAGLVLVHSLPWLSGVVVATSTVESLAIIFGFATLFFAVSTIGILRHADDEKALATYTSPAGLVGLMLVLWIQFGAPDSYKIVLMLLWAATFLAVGE